MGESYREVSWTSWREIWGGYGFGLKFINLKKVGNLKEGRK